MSNQFQIVCSLCFCSFNIKDDKYTCAEPKCNIVACLECIEALIAFNNFK